MDWKRCISALAIGAVSLAAAAQPLGPEQKSFHAIYKALASAFVSVLSQLKREGFRPKRDLILALTADEERGDVPSNGVYWLVNDRRDLIDAEFGINEGGGGELRDGKPFLHRIQVAEKMYTTYQFTVRNPV